MRIHNWLEDLFTSKSKIRIVRLVLRYPRKEFTEREIAELIKMSPNTVNLALREIRRTNLLTFRRIGKAHAYRLNEKSGLCRNVENIMETEKKAEKDMFDMVRSALGDSISCIVFGSFARGEESFDSDMDLLIIGENKESIMNSIEKLQSELSESFSTTLSPIVLTPYELKEKWKKGLLREIAREGIPISGKSLEELHGKGGLN